VLDYINKESNSRILDSLDFGSEAELRGAKTFSFFKITVLTTILSDGRCRRSGW
jgi:hypothetical protein